MPPENLGSFSIVMSKSTAQYPAHDDDFHGNSHFPRQESSKIVVSNRVEKTLVFQLLMSVVS
ncbi:hypothetical protein GOZ90_13760 [Agrobacterium vitis]|uniref:Uncharacterized protein n=2 Tax=Agrobacterium vitis TaxID=373 RepID=A0A109CLQ9_AGRVI|nr:hypothetical protein [Agrobacterium vitis]KAA3509735.1 hypothetical protein DXM22_19535 [Agrobacterium vitis]KAA3523358.1 hypothetical protein DXT89_20585 [Agrobacterium vitis]MUZ73749.1 hypothetical protein [Agrobacterium vitis]MVA56487.1 hypothetical protein [Agrobacterium vitis]RCU51205.1 hypothetical protein ASB66_019730 [Agrobacterium vitis]